MCFGLCRIFLSLFEAQRWTSLLRLVLIFQYESLTVIWFLQYAGASVVATVGK